MLPSVASVSKAEADKTMVINKTTTNLLTLVEGPGNYVELKEGKNGLVDNPTAKPVGITKEKYTKSCGAGTSRSEQGNVFHKSKPIFFQNACLECIDPSSFGHVSIVCLNPVNVVNLIDLDSNFKTTLVAPS